MDDTADLHASVTSSKGLLESFGRPLTLCCPSTDVQIRTTRGGFGVKSATRPRADVEGVSHTRGAESFAPSRVNTEELLTERLLQGDS